jgi:hypothetical protein
MAALPGLTLLEGGVPTDAPSVQRAAKFIRARVPQLSETYELALSILFLDRLGDRKDHQAIQTLALRLVAGQHQTGGWGYQCPVLAPKQERDLLLALQKKQPLPSQTPTQSHDMPAEDTTFSTNNSTTQFAVLGLWAARRHHVPLERALALVVQRFRASQARGGGWNYLYETRAGGFTPSMTGAGLLGLAVGYGLTADGLSSPAREELARDAAIQKGLKVLSESIGKPLIKASGDQVFARLNLYFFWTVERVGMAYNLQTIHGKEWYPWGAGEILARQERDGSWNCGGYSGATPVADTCFALLFLKRTNLTHDLTAIFKGRGPAGGRAEEAVPR